MADCLPSIHIFLQQIKLVNARVFDDFGDFTKFPYKSERVRGATHFIFGLGFMWQNFWKWKSPKIGHIEYFPTRTS